MKNAMLILITFTKFILSMKSKKEYILFSESKYYRNHFEKLIEKLNNNPDSDVHFFTSDYDEYIYKIAPFWLAPSAYDQIHKTISSRSHHIARDKNQRRKPKT